MLSKETSNFDEAVDIGKIAANCKKEKKYNLAKAYFIESAQRLIALSRDKLIPDEKQAAVRNVIKYCCDQAEECKKLFHNELEALKKDSHCKEIINNVIMTPDQVSFDSIIGLDQAKQVLRETLILPHLRPDLFTGIRSPPRGILFYGPPGNGKTFIAKAVSRECNATFINISASTIVSKWMGEGEKMMKALFQVAGVCQPSIVFIDEIDSLLAERKENDHESSRRLKTEFLVQFDGLNNSQADRISLIAATNLPNLLDPAALRRFAKKILIPLPNEQARYHMIKHLLSQVAHSLTEKELAKIAKSLDYYSASDISNLVKEAAMEPLRKFTSTEMMGISKYEIRLVGVKDFDAAKKTILPSLSKNNIAFYVDLEKRFGSIDK